MNRVHALQILESHHQRAFNLAPLKPRSKIPLLKRREYRLNKEDFLRFLAQDTNWAIRWMRVPMPSSVQDNVK